MESQRRPPTSPQGVLGGGSERRPPILSHNTYHPKGYGVSEGLRRAREPYVFRNSLIGMSLLGFVGSVYWWSIQKVKQDDFSDLADLRADNNARALRALEDAEDEAGAGAARVGGAVQHSWNATKAGARQEEKKAEKAWVDLRNPASTDVEGAKRDVKKGWLTSKGKAEDAAQNAKQGWFSTKAKAEDEAQKGWFMAKSKAYEGAEQAKQGWFGAKSTVQSEADKAHDEAERAWNSTRNKARDGAEQARQAYLAARERVEQEVQRFNSSADRASSTVRDRANEAAQQAHDQWHAAQRRAEETAEQVKSRATQAADDDRHRAEDAADSVRQTATSATAKARDSIASTCVAGKDNIYSAKQRTEKIGDSSRRAHQWWVDELAKRRRSVLIMRDGKA